VIYKHSGAGTNERTSAVWVVSAIRDEFGAHRVLINIAEGGHKLAQRPDDLTLEPIVPDVPLQRIRAIEPPGEYAEDPLHDLRQTLLARRLDHQMEVIIHNTHVDDAKRVFRLCPLYGFEKHALHIGASENQLPPVGPRDYMVDTADSCLPRSPHTRDYWEN
jgi:hypothetical protein